MKREIKFRAWDSVLNEYLPNVQNHINDKEWAFGSMLKNERWNIEQYTGLKDKNGIEIYEGDITKNGYIIMWNSEKCLFAEHFKNTITNEFIVASYPINSEYIEIIGNIHQNPELL